MTTPPKPPLPPSPATAASPAGAAAELVNAFLDGDLTEAQGRELTAWLEADPEHLRFFVRETHAHHALHEIILSDLARRRDAEILIVDADADTDTNARAARAPRTAPLRVTERPARATARWRKAGLAIAAAAVLTLGGWWYLATRYPAPQIDAAIELTGQNGLTRGAELRTAAIPGNLELGGYCNVALQPHSLVRLEGDPKAEALYLAEGAVDCQVDRHVGTFTVSSEVGSVSVTGTQFSVRLLPQAGVQPMKGKAMAWLMAVSVTVGSVHVNYNGHDFPVLAGESRLFGADNDNPPPPPPPPQGNNQRPGAGGPTQRPNRPPPPPPPGDDQQGGNDGPGGPGGPGEDPNRPKGPPPPLLMALDTDKDGELSADELKNAPESLKKLDKNGDGKIDREELRPTPPPGGQNPPPPIGQTGQNPGSNRNGNPGGANVPPQGRRQGPPPPGGNPQGQNNRRPPQGPGGTDAQGGAGEQGGPQGPDGNDPNKPKGPVPPLMHALDTDKDGELSAEEIAAATQSLLKLDHNGDGKLDRNELRPPPPPGEGPGPGEGDGGAQGQRQNPPPPPNNNNGNNGNNRGPGRLPPPKPVEHDGEAN